MTQLSCRSFQAQYLFHKINRLASCPLGLVTANGVDLLTETYIIYIETHTSHRAIARYQKSCPQVHRLLQEKWQHMEGRKARKYITIILCGTNFKTKQLLRFHFQAYCLYDYRWRSREIIDLVASIHLSVSSYVYTDGEMDVNIQQCHLIKFLLRQATATQSMD